MIKKTSQATKYRLPALGFRLKSCSSPIFLSSTRLAFIGSRGVEIWNTTTGEPEARIKSAPRTGCFAYSEKENWIATKNDDGQLMFSSFSDGEMYKATTRPPYQDGSNIDAHIDGIHIIDTSYGGDIYVHNAKTGEIVFHESLDNDWMTAGVQVTTRQGDIWAAFNRKAGIRMPGSEESALLKHSWPISLKRAKKIQFKHSIQRVSIDQSGTRVAVVFEPSGIKKPAILTILDADGKQLSEVELPGHSVFFCPPAWSPTSDELAVVLDRNLIVFLDAKSLEIKQKAYGPHLTGIAYSPDGNLVAIAADSGGVVLPRTEIAEWSDKVGRPAAELAEAKYQAFSRRIALRKAGPPRAAVFKSPEGIVVEAECLVGLFRYLPQPNPEILPLDCSSQDLGDAVIRALARFAANSSAHDRILGPAFPGESDQLIALGVRPEQIKKVRYLGHDIPFEADVSHPASSVSVCLWEGLIDLWPNLNVDDGLFAESDWPRIVLDEKCPNESLGLAILEALSLVKLSRKN